MATTKRLERLLDHAVISARLAKGAITKNLLVTLDLVTDDEGFTIKQLGGLSQKPFGVCADSWADGKMAGVIESGIVPIVCVDASVAANVPVYNDATGKVSATQGAGASLVGTTRSKTSA